MTTPRPPFSNDDLWAMAWRLYALTNGLHAVPAGPLVPDAIRNEDVSPSIQGDHIESLVIDIHTRLEEMTMPAIDYDKLADMVATRVAAQLRTLTFTLRPPEQTSP